MGSPPPPPPFLPDIPQSKSSFILRHKKRHSVSVSSVLLKQWLPRTTFIALFSLFFVSVYVLLIAGPSNLKPVSPHPSNQPDAFRTTVNHWANTNKVWKSSHKDIIASRPQISLTPQQELAAVSSFIISLPSQNVIPSSVDPSQPIDPQLVLDFDTRADGAKAELAQLTADVWDVNPVVIYSKASAAARHLRSTIDTLNLAPAPVVIDLLDRSDSDVLEQFLARVTSSPLPILLVHGVPVDVSSVDRIKSLSKSGSLQKIISDAGVVVGGGKRRRSRR